ncbi:tyrosine-protein phosphatase [Rhodococcus sp. NPDC058514]|uniref:tyrosine-protein phosphatase n=1 Tax=unclassified Rhodococcus (in: high G+C Gram-positive bacteria) TaxID=192944 RepID=UPI00364B724E
MTLHLRRAAATSAMCGVLLASPLMGTAFANPLDGLFAPLFSGSSPGTSHTAPAADAPRLASVDNFRDVAGTGAGYAGSGGDHVRKGVFYRSNAVVPDDADLVSLEGLHPTQVYDLRTPDEVAAKPDRVPAGASYVNIPIRSGDLTGAATQLRSPDEARAFMQNLNRGFVTGAGERAGFKQLLTDLANTDGPQVFHCTAGKDRTGWTSFLLLSIAGVSRETIMSDYLLTNEYSAAFIAATRAQMAAASGEQIAAIYTPLLGVEASYLGAGIAELDAIHGSVENYLKDGLGLDGGTIADLKDKLLS